MGQCSYCRGGGWFSHITKSHDRETDGQRDTRDGSSKPTRRTAKNFQYPHGLQYAKYPPSNIIILTGEDDASRFDSWQYNTVSAKSLDRSLIKTPTTSKSENTQ
jgi:hypothetical protein